MERAGSARSKSVMKGSKRGNTEQTSITQFMAKRQKRDKGKHSPKKRKSEAGRACSTPLHTTDQHGKDDDDDEDEAEDDKTAATKDNKGEN